ncbi:hypothetical protein B566_EDAN000188 [Ephemera danica]|nr:hypothetical protein B566_EDAN000188 [Ephemera danica]
MAPASPSNALPQSMPEALLQRLGAAVLERVGTGNTFRLIGDPPLWWAATFKTSPETPIDVGSLAPFLQHFLDECESAWSADQHRVVRSGPWSHRDHTSILHQFEATALTASYRPLLLIERVNERFDQIQSLLQHAREQRLYHLDQVKTHERTQTTLMGSLAIATQERDDVLALLQQLDLAAIVTNQEGRVTFISPRCRAWIEHPATTVIGQPWEHSLPLEAADRQHLRQTWHARTPQRGRRPLRLTSTTPRWIDYEIHEDPHSSERRVILLHDRTEVYELRQQLDHQTQFHDLVGRSPAMLQVYQLVRDVARVDATVLIEGETGTGKELIARAIHYSSPREGRPFIAANCAGLTDSLLGSQLFGHKRGAFTGAIDDHHGLFEAADGGTLFLDEIGDIPTSVQSSLLRVLQEKEITRLGETHPRKVNVRILAATHHNLNEDVIRGTFRADLLYRIRVARIHLPPLRERRDDIPLLISALLGQVCAATGKQITGLHPDSLHLLMAYAWPGNVRELKSAVEFAVISAHAACLMPADFPEELRHPQRDDRSPSVQTPHHTEPKTLLLRALQQAHGNRTEAAKILGISRATLYRRLLAHHIDVAEPRSTTPPPIRVVPVDDSAFAREGLRAILKLDRGIQVVGEADSRARAVKEVQRTKPDVVLMDMRLPDGTGSDACRDILSAFPRMRILFFSAYNDDHDLYDAVMAGGHGYLTKDVGIKELTRAIKTIAAGRSLARPKEAAPTLSGMEDTTLNTPAVLPSILSPTDLKLLSMLAAGATKKALAAAFRLHPNAISKFLSALYKKLHVTRRTHAVHYYVTHLSPHHESLNENTISTRIKG